jgi:HPt (histidine-containing phosphotransfer) domain-containing protein
VADGPALDAETFAQLTDLMLEELPGLARDFLATTRQLLDRIAEAEAAHDLVQLRRHTHALQPSAATLGALRFGRMVRDLGAQAAAGQLVGARGTLASLEHEFARIRHELERRVLREAVG